MARGGKHKPKDVAERKCIATGQVRPKAKLMRFVVGPEGQVVPDVAGKLPGRGIWISTRRSALEKAVAKNLFSRAAKQSVTCPEGLLDQTEALLVSRIIELLSLSRKSGTAIAGFEKIKGWLEQDRVCALLQASDGSDREKSRLRQRGSKIPAFAVLTSNELGLAFGRENVIHSALAAGGLTNLVVEEAARLQGLRDADGGKPAEKDTKNT